MSRLELKKWKFGKGVLLAFASCLSYFVWLHSTGNQDAFFMDFIFSRQLSFLLLIWFCASILLTPALIYESHVAKNKAFFPFNFLRFSLGFLTTLPILAALLLAVLIFQHKILQTKFDSKKWLANSTPFYTNLLSSRALMANDIIESSLLNGKNYDEVIALLGEDYHGSYGIGTNNCYDLGKGPCYLWEGEGRDYLCVRYDQLGLVETVGLPCEADAGNCLDHWEATKK